jgi:hypothetical protein
MDPSFTPSFSLFVSAKMTNARIPVPMVSARNAVNKEIGELEDHVG